MAGTLRTIELLDGLDPLGIDNVYIPFETIEKIALAEVAYEQLIEQLETELMRKIYVLRQAGVTSPQEIAETLGITLRGAQTWTGRLDQQLLTKINDDGN